MILVTGATGFVGRHVVEALRERELPVRCLVRNRSNAGALVSLGCELVEGEMTDRESLVRAVPGCDAVVHLVAIRQGRPELFERIMTQGTRDLVGAAQQAGVRRFVHMSALGTTEQTKDLVPYFRSKWDMEQIVQGSRLEHVVFRPSFIFGRDGGLLPTFVRLARLAPVTPVVGAGTQRIQPIWVDDVAAFFAAAVDKPEATNRTFELGGPDAVSWDELYDRIKRVLRIRRPTVHVPMRFMRMQATVVERLPGNIPLTRDLLRMLEAGDNVADTRLALQTFQLPLVPLDEQIRRAA